MTGTTTPNARPYADNGTGDINPASSPPPTDQQKFDAEVARDGGIFLHVLGAVGIMGALALSTIALVVATQSHATTIVMPAAPVAAAPVAAAPAAAAPILSTARTIKFSVAGGVKRGPDGKMHDAFSKTNFAVKVGKPTRMVIDNKDDSPHSITAPGTGVSIIVKPGVHTYTMLATKAGRFMWMCVIPCDSDAHGWAMTHPGYMAGYINVT
jgi:hypothetical protein